MKPYQAAIATALGMAAASGPASLMTRLLASLGWAGASHIRARRRGPGWTLAQVRRMARKRRNKARHRARCQRKGRRA